MAFGLTDGEIHERWEDRLAAGRMDERILALREQQLTGAVVFDFIESAVIGLLAAVIQENNRRWEELLRQAGVPLPRGPAAR